MWTSVRGFHLFTSQLNLSRFVTETRPIAQRVPRKVLTSSQEVDECEPLLLGR